MESHTDPHDSQKGLVSLVVLGSETFAASFSVSTA